MSGDSSFTLDADEQRVVRCLLDEVQRRGILTSAQRHLLIRLYAALIEELQKLGGRW